jgi:hypothetical protein
VQLSYVDMASTLEGGKAPASLMATTMAVLPPSVEVVGPISFVITVTKLY